MQNAAQLDLTGKLIIKVALGDDIRRIPIHNEDITYDELVLMMQRVYRGKLSTNDEVTIKYKDEDGDLITIFDSSDLTFAIQCSRILKITLFVGGSKSILEPCDSAGIRQELQGIRDRVINLLDRLEPTGNVSSSQPFNIKEAIVYKGDDASKGTLPASNSTKPINAVGGKEFDPLSTQKSVDDSTQNKVMSSFGMDVNAVTSTSQPYDRAATPDSVSSAGSSASNQVRAQMQNAQQPSLPGTAPPQPGAAGPQQQQQPPFAPMNPQQQQPPQQPPQQPQQQPQGPYPGQPVYSQPGQMPQSYAGQPAFGASQQQGQAPPGQQPQQPQQPQQSQGPPQQQYDPAMYNQYNQGYPGAAGQPGSAPMYGQPGGSPGPYGAAPGIPQPKAQGFPPGPTGPGMAPSPGNPYSRGGPSYGTGYPRPSAGYPQ